MDDVDISVGRYLDDLIYFNLRVDSTAGLDRSVISEEGIRKVMQIKERYGVRTQICLAGWWTTTGRYFAGVVLNDSLRERLVDNVLDFCLQYGFDGVDYDWEHPQSQEETEAYADLFEETRDAFAPHGMIVSAAVSGHKLFPTRAYAALDKIHIMSYGGRHITYDAGVYEASIFLERRDIPREKLYFGTPFYGYSNDGRPYYTYRRIVELYDPGPEFNIVDGIMYQGIYAQERRTLFAHAQHMGGMMIWEIGQDAPGEKSLLRAIHRTVAELKKLPPPRSFRMRPSTSANHGILLQFSEIPGAAGYRVVLRSAAGATVDSLDVDSTRVIFSSLTPDSLYYARVLALDSEGGRGRPSKTMAATAGARSEQAVIVNDYDPWHKPLDLIERHAPLLHRKGYGISSVYGPDIAEGIELDDAAIVDWMAGDKGHYDPAIDESNRMLLARYLEQGGRLFISGSNIGYDLYLKGTVDEKLFYLSTLKAFCRDDAPNDLISQFYTLEPAPGSIFDGMDAISFDNGESGCYNVFNPDVLDPKNLSQAGFTFTGMERRPDAACTYYRGPFGDGAAEGALVYLSVPFESVVSAKDREEMLSGIVDYFRQPTLVMSPSQPFASTLFRNYPNPFNSAATIEYETTAAADVAIRIYNLLGETICRHAEKSGAPGVHRFRWNAEGQPAGVYFYEVRIGAQKYGGRMVYVK